MLLKTINSVIPALDGSNEARETSKTTENKKIKAGVIGIKTASAPKTTKDKNIRAVETKALVKSIIVDQSYSVSDIIIERTPYQFKNLTIENKYVPSLLVYLLQRRFAQSLPSKIQYPICGSKDISVNYIYEYDIYNQAFNSSFQRLQSNLADWTSNELYKRNLISYITDKVRLTKIIDISKQYNNRSTIRLCFN